MKPSCEETNIFLSFWLPSKLEVRPTLEEVAASCQDTPHVTFTINLKSLTALSLDKMGFQGLKPETLSEGHQGSAPLV